MKSQNFTNQTNLYKSISITIISYTKKTEDSRRQKMLAIFQKTFAHPPEELNSPASNLSGKTPKLPGETLSDFLSNYPDSAFSMSFGDSAVLAFARPENSHRPRYNNKHIPLSINCVSCPPRYINSTRYSRTGSS